MRRYKQNRRRPNNFNLIIVGCGFVIVMMIALYMIDYFGDNKNNHFLPYSELKQSHDLIREDIVYDFFNEIFDLDSNLIDSIEYKKIVCFSIGYSKEMKRFIGEFPDSVLNQSDKDYMISQMSTESLLWDNSRFNKCWILAPNDLNKINSSNCIDYWEEFYRLFGKYGEHKYSKPIFNENYTFAVFEHSGQGGCLVGSGEIVAFIRINGKWKYYTEKQLWIS